MRTQGLPPSCRLHLKRDFKRIIQGGRKFEQSGLVLWADFTRGTGSARFAVVVSKKLGPAVVRNRTKRILREAFRTSDVRFTQGADFIVKPLDSEKLPTVQAAQLALTSLGGLAARK
ncbi:MAG: ribonuclease P protein component [Elusimicrobiaceae bacterium]|nr:ribonuclease P protein component [Elusimicrobiaceae bacterium]MBP5616284.1 ribonuclease P protein component [Elusimicrobiaceae bacterium]